MSRSFGRWVLAVIGAAVVAACSPSTPGGDEASIWLLISNYGSDRVEILSTADDLDDLVRGTPLTNPGGACGVAVHGDRLYVADYDAGVVRAFPLGAALGGGAPAPLATIGSASLFGPCGLAFDEDGTLWVGDYDLSHVVAFRGVGALSGTPTLAPDVVLTVGGGGVTAWSGIIEILIDGDGRLWVVDEAQETVTRIDDVADLTGVQAGRTPDAQILWAFADAPPAGGTYTIATPYSVAVDASGRLYVGNYDEGYVSRFDGAGSLAGVAFAQPSAYLVVAAIDYPHLVALDDDGALWIGNDTQVVRVPSPQSGSGVRNLVPTATVTYAPSGFNDGGGMTFVPMPADLGFTPAAGR